MISLCQGQVSQGRERPRRAPTVVVHLEEGEAFLLACMRSRDVAQSGPGQAQAVERHGKAKGIISNLTEEGGTLFSRRLGGRPVFQAPVSEPEKAQGAAQTTFLREVPVGRGGLLQPGPHPGKVALVETDLAEDQDPIRIGGIPHGQRLGDRRRDRDRGLLSRDLRLNAQSLPFDGARGQAFGPLELRAIHARACEGRSDRPGVEGRHHRPRLDGRSAIT